MSLNLLELQFFHLSKGDELTKEIRATVIANEATDRKEIFLKFTVYKAFLFISSPTRILRFIEETGSGSTEPRPGAVVSQRLAQETAFWKLSGSVKCEAITVRAIFNGRCITLGFLGNSVFYANANPIF